MEQQQQQQQQQQRQQQQQSSRRINNFFFTIPLLCLAALLTKAMLYATRVAYYEENERWLDANWRDDSENGTAAKNALFNALAIVGCVDDIFFMVLGIYVVTSAWRNEGIYRKKAQNEFVWFVVATRFMILLWGLNYQQDDSRKYDMEESGEYIWFVWHSLLNLTILVAMNQTFNSPDGMEYARNSPGWIMYGDMMVIHAVIFPGVVSLAALHETSLEGQLVFSDLARLYTVEVVIVAATPYLVLAVVSWSWSPPQDDDESNDYLREEQQEQLQQPP